MLKKRKIKNFKKNFYILLSGATLFSASILTLAACSSVDQKLIDNSTQKGNGDFFTSNQSLASFSKEALLNTSGQTSYFNAIANQLALNWLSKAGNELNQIDYKNKLDRQIKVIDEEYKMLVDKSKKEYGSNFDLMFQQKVLDLEGGTEQAWKQKKLFEWARSNVQDLIFEKDFLAVKKNSSSIVSTPTATDIKDAVSNTSSSSSSSSSFVFSEDAIAFAQPSKKAIYKKYAKFQEFVFNKWVELENPFIINNVSWKYDTPKQGINSIYYVEEQNNNGDANGSGDGNSSSSSSNYKYPYFSSETSSNENYNAVEKFTKFVTDGKSNSSSGGGTSTNGNNFITDQTLGLRTIDAKYSQESSTLLLVKGSSSFSEKPIQLATVANYQLYKKKPTSITSSNDFPTISDIDNDIQHTITTTTTQGVDGITSNFVNTSSINNLNIKLSSTLLKNIVKVNGQFSQLLSKDLYVTDLIKDSSLSDFVFARTDTGVNAVAIEGKTFIEKATSFKDFKEKAAKIVQYHYLMNKYGYSNFSLNLNSELKSFFSSNFDWLIYEYAKDTSITSDQQLFDVSVFSQQQKTLNEALSNFIKQKQYASKQQDYQKRMFEAKKAYADNYGVNAFKNGFAAPWAYSYQTNSTNFDIVKTVTNFDPYSSSNANSNKSTYDTLVEAISSFISNLNLVPQTSDFVGYKYSQYIYTNNFFINLALISFGNDGDAMGQSLKLKTLINSSASYFNNVNLEFNGIKDVSSFTKAKEGLNLGLNNFFYNNYFANLENHWKDYTNSSSSSPPPTSTNGNIALTNLNEYRKKLWKDNAINPNLGLSQFYSLYSLVITVNYLLENDAKEFLKYLQSKMTYGSDSYIVWSGSENIFLNPPTTTSPPAASNNKTVSTLLNVDQNNLTMNINNNYKSSYFGSKPSETTAITNNTKESNPLFTNPNSYYQYVNGSIGFQGFQSSNSSDLPVPIQERLFTDVKKNKDNTGLLYAYESLDKLKNLINSYTNLDELNILANSLQKKINTLSLSDFNLATSISTKKIALINEITKLNSNTTNNGNMFDPRTGYISEGKLTEGNGTLIVDPDNTNLMYGAKVIHLNLNDVSSLNNLSTAINKLPNGTNSGTSTTNKTSEIFYNLVIQAASDLNLQTKVIDQIAINNRVSVYDARLEKQLGYQWIKN